MPGGSGFSRPPPPPPPAHSSFATTSAADSSGVRPPGQDVPRIIAESDVFVKYGLLDRAVDHLRRAFEIQPDYLPAREKLAAVLTQLGRRSEAAAELEYMAEALADTDRAQALKLAERARVLDPERDARARAARGRQRGRLRLTARRLSPRPQHRDLGGGDPGRAAAARAPPPAQVLDDLDGIEAAEELAGDDLELDVDEVGRRRATSPAWIW